MVMLKIIKSSVDIVDLAIYGNVKNHQYDIVDLAIYGNVKNHQLILSI